MRFLLKISYACFLAHGLADEQCAEEQQLHLLQQDWKIDEKRTLRGDTIGSTTAAIDGSCRDNACEYGILLCEAMLRRGNEDGFGTEIALYNGGGIRAGLRAGEITRADLQKVHPFGNNVTYFKLKGESIEQMLGEALKEHGVGPGEAGNWLQVAGLRFQAGRNGTEWSLKNVVVKTPSGRWAPLNSSKLYSVASNSYIMHGNGGRDVAKDNLELLEANGPSVLDLMANFFSKKSPVSPPKQDGRTYHEDSLKVLGAAAGVLDGSKQDCRDHSCSYGVLLTEEMLRLGQADGYGTQIALYNGGGIRASVDVGNVVLDNLFEVHPFGNLVSFFKLKGDILSQLLENMLVEHGSPGNGTSGSWLQMAGLRFQASWDGSAWKLGEVDVLGEQNIWEPLQKSIAYSVVSNSYIRFGNGGRKVVSANAEPLLDDGESVLELMSGLFESKSPVTPPADDERECLSKCSW